MARQLSIGTHCLLCLNDVETPQQSYGAGTGRRLYIRKDGGLSGFDSIASICRNCLGYIRGGNWPTDVYAKLSADRKVEGERAAEAILAS